MILQNFFNGIRLLVLFITLYTYVNAQDIAKRIENNKSFEYDSVMSVYERLAVKYPAKAKLLKAGPTDCGRPLHLFVISDDGTLDAAAAKSKNKTIVFINNGIHPGEP